MVINPNLPAQPVARAQRFPIQAPMQYRTSGQQDWSQGSTLNISRSGVLFSAREELKPETLLEMCITFAPEITGGQHVNFVCWGPVVRAEPAAAESSDPHPSVAATFLKYKIARE